MEIDYARDSWFAGFADGEGSFGLVNKRQPVKRNGTIVRYEIVGVQPWFTLGLRADDVAVLEGLRETFGGSVRFDDAPNRQRDGHARHPRYQWVVCAKSDLLALVAYFDQFALRAKKAKDYGVWRRAVRIYVARGARAPELRELRDALMEVRQYEAPVVALREVAVGH